MGGVRDGHEGKEDHGTGHLRKGADNHNKSTRLQTCVPKLKTTSDTGTMTPKPSRLSGSSNRQPGSITINTSDTLVSFSAITAIKVSKFAYSSTTTSESIIQELLDKEIVIARNENPNEFGIFTCTAVTQDSVETDFYDLTLTHKRSNGSIEKNKFFSLLLYSGAQDKDFRHNQTSASASWVINHNLNKYPSVVSFDSTGNQAIGSITYNSKNQLTITFSASFSGAAYLN